MILTFIQSICVSVAAVGSPSACIHIVSLDHQPHAQTCHLKPPLRYSALTVSLLLLLSSPGNQHMCTCTLEYMHAMTRTLANTQTHTHIHEYTHTYTPIHTNTLTHTRIHTHAHTCRVPQGHTKGCVRWCLRTYRPRPLQTWVRRALLPCSPSCLPRHRNAS